MCDVDKPYNKSSNMTGINPIFTGNVFDPKTESLQVVDFMTSGVGE
jgi:hypothetical protein